MTASLTSHAPLDFRAAAVVQKPRLDGGGWLVTVRRSGVSVWQIDREGIDRNRVPFDRSSVAAWQRSRWALGLTLPCLWRLPEVQPAGATLVGSVPRKGARPSPEGLLTGASFGLAFFLEMAVRALGLRPRSGVVALAGVTADARPQPVDGVAEKVAVAVALDVVGASLVLVDPCNLGEARAAARGRGVRVAAVPDLRTALTLVFGAAVEKRVVALGVTAEDREALSRSLHDVVLRGEPCGGWAPVERMARLALKSWPVTGSGSVVEWRLAFVAGVAARHQRNAGALPPVTRATLRRLVPTAGARLRVIAQYVQQAVDTGRPSARELRQLLRGTRPRTADAFAEHAFILGGIGRLDAVTGRPERAIATARVAACRLLDLQQGKEASRPLSEWFRLAGTLRRPDAFLEAESFLKELERRHVRLPALSRLYVELARGRALAGLGRTREAVAVLRVVQRRALERQHHEIAGSATRWLARCGQIVARPRDPIFATLMGLDRAIADEDNVQARVALRRLARREPGLLRHLTRAARDSGRDLSKAVQEYYPY